MLRNSFCLAFAYIVITLLAGCNKTRYFRDVENPQVAIFSNKGYNLMTCTVNGQGWQTIPRKVGLVSTSTEMMLEIEPGNGNKDTLLITWYGGYATNPNDFDDLTIKLAIAAKSTFESLTALQGQRIHIDSTVNGYFYTSINNQTGNGDIFFQKVRVNGTGSISIAGLLSATIKDLNVENGRFDHQ